MSIPRRTPLKRGKRIKPRNSKRKRELFAEQFGSEERVRWMKLQNCCVCGRTPCEVAHVKSRGAGGKADDTVPLCAACHASQHQQGIKTFQTEHDIDLKQKAAVYATRWAERGDYDLGF